MAQGVPGRLRPRIFLTFGTRVVGRQPYAPAAFTAGDIPGTHFQRLSRPQGTWFCRGYHGKKNPVTPPRIDPGTVRLVAHCLNHYATPGLQRINRHKIACIILHLCLHITCDKNVPVTLKRVNNNCNLATGWSVAVFSTFLEK